MKRRNGEENRDGNKRETERKTDETEKRRENGWLCETEKRMGGQINRGPDNRRTGQPENQSR